MGAGPVTAHKTWCSALVTGCDCGLHMSLTEFERAWQRCERLRREPDEILRLERYVGGYVASTQSVGTGFYGSSATLALEQLADAMEQAA